MLFWLIAGVMAAAAALWVSARAAAASRDAAEGAAADPAVALHARQLGELDELHGRGLLHGDELEAARAEAGRRLLAAADRPRPAEGAGGSLSRMLVTLGAGAAAVSALALYLAVGRPAAPDQPYGARLSGWLHADPAALAPAELAAVLRRVSQRRPQDPQAWEFLGRARLAAGDPGDAATAFARAGRLAPGNADYPAAAGEALMAGANGKVTPEAEAAFREALRRDSRSPAARYHLAKLAVSQGDLAGGRTALRALLSDLRPDDPRRAELAAEIAAADAPISSSGPSQGQVAAAARGAPAAGPEQAAFIRGMVDRLAQRLASRPDDAEGWARLVRAYGVLGDTRARADALTRARTVFARRPAELARIEAEARAPAP